MSEQFSSSLSPLFSDLLPPKPRVSVPAGTLAPAPYLIRDSSRRMPAQRCTNPFYQRERFSRSALSCSECKKGCGFDAAALGVWIVPRCAGLASGAGALAGHGDGSGAGDALDAVRLADLDEGLDLGLGPADLDHDGLVADVDDAAAEHLDQREDLGALLGQGRDADEHEVAGDDGLADVVLDLDDRDDLGQLLADLLEDAVVADDDDGHAAELRVLGAADDQRIDVEGPRGEHARDVGQDARFVLDECIDYVLHGKPRFLWH